MSDINPFETNSLHAKAMDLVDRAVTAGKTGNYPKLLSLFAEAFVIEKQAAMTLVGKLDCEPSRSVLFRSAGAIALRCQDFQGAIKMAAQGFLGNPPEAIARELRGVMITAWEAMGVR